MKILFVNYRYSVTGGSEQYFILQIKKALDMGHTPVVVCGEKNHIHIKGVKSFYIPDINKIARTIRSLLKIHKIITKMQPDCAYVHNLDNPLLNYYISAKIPSLKFLHSYDHVCPITSKFLPKSQYTCTSIRGKICYRECIPFSLRSLYLSMKNFSEPFFYSQYKSLAVFSDFVMNEFQKIYNTPLIKLRYFCPLRPTENNSVSDNTVLFVGRLIKEKGIYHIIDACSAISVPYTLIIAGDGPERQQAEAYAKEKSVNCVWKGWISNEETAQLYEKASVLAVPSIWPEPFGIIGLEAMNFSKPVVAFHSGGIPEWLHHEKNGYLIEHMSSEKMGHKIEYILRNPDIAQRMGKAGKQLLREKYDVSLFEEEFKKITDFLLSSS